jgi:hypothetical protein
LKAKHLILWCVVSAALWSPVGFLLGAAFLAEEGDSLANCHVYGNEDCGPGAPWHGFVGGE